MSDTPAPPLKPEPSRATLITWLRANLALTVFVFGLLSGAGTTLISYTQSIAAAKYRQETMETTLDKQAAELAGLHADMADVDRRLNQDAAHVADLQRSRDGQLAGLAQRIAVLEAQLRFLADRTPPQPVGTRK